MPGTNTFKSMMEQVDEDFEKIKTESSPRERLYYSVEINGSSTEIIARSLLMRSSNRTRISFLIHSQSGSNYSRIYLSELDVIEILCRLSDTDYAALTTYLIELYREEASAGNTSVTLRRAPILDSERDIEISATSEVISLPKPAQDSSIAIHNGQSIKLFAFYDCLSLILSTENPVKIKQVLAKYYILSLIGRTGASPVRLGRSLAAARSINDIRKAYNPNEVRFSDMQKLDKQVFSAQNVVEYMTSA